MDNIKFFYAIKNVRQLGFGGMSRVEDEIVGEGHIVANDQLLCGLGRDKVKKVANAQRHTVRMSRVPHIKICEKCEKRYKENPRFQWKKWENMVT